MDPQDRLRVADALYAHAQHVLRRNSQRLNVNMSQTKATASTSRQSRTRCVLTFKDIAQNSPCQSRSHLSQILRDIRSLVPDWITWIDPEDASTATPAASTTNGDNDNNDTAQLSNQTTVWIETDDYKTVRSRLSVSQVSQVSSSTTEGDDQSLPLAVVLSLPEASVVAVEGNQSSPTPELQPDDMSTSETTATTPATAASTPTKVGTKRTIGGNTKRGRPSRKRDQNNSNDTESEPASDHVLESPTKKRRKSLRVNPNFILCDADYSGGEVIQPSYGTPRDLKSLFDKMNAGERI